MSIMIILSIGLNFELQKINIATAKWEPVEFSAKNGTYAYVEIIQEIIFWTFIKSYVMFFSYISGYKKH